MINKIKTQPDSEPLTLNDCRAFLGISDSADTNRDYNIKQRIKAAREYAENYTERAFINQTWQAFCDDLKQYVFLQLKTDLVYVSSIKYIDLSGVEQTLAANQYRVDLVSNRVYPAYGVVWPGCRGDANSVVVEYVRGMAADGGDLPEMLKEAMRQIIYQWEIHQTAADGVMMPMTIRHAANQLLEPFRDYSQAFA